MQLTNIFFCYEIDVVNIFLVFSTDLYLIQQKVYVVSLLAEMEAHQGKLNDIILWVYRAGSL